MELHTFTLAAHSHALLLEKTFSCVRAVSLLDGCWQSVSSSFSAAEARCGRQKGRGGKARRGGGKKGGKKGGGEARRGGGKARREARREAKREGGGQSW